MKQQQTNKSPKTKQSKCILKSHLQPFHYGFTVITLQMSRIKTGKTGLKKGHFNIIYAHAEFMCQHFSLHVQFTALSIHIIIITKITG